MSLIHVLKARSIEDVYKELIKKEATIIEFDRLIQYNKVDLIGRILKDDTVEKEIRNAWQSLLDNLQKSIQHVLETNEEK